MRKDFEDYLRSISLTSTLIEKVDAIYEMYRSFCPEEIDSIFVENYVTQEGTMNFDELWFFSKHYLLNSPQFASEDIHTMGRLDLPLFLFKITKQDYDLQKATSKSRIAIEFRMSDWPDASGDMKASGENCDHLWGTFLTRFIRR
jgi:hypothetical protein